MANKFADQKLIPIEEALDRRTNHNGMVEYLVKLHNEDKMEWVPWTNIYCPQLMDTQPDPTKQLNATQSGNANDSQSSHGIIDV